jgi:hypothetical protein
VLEVPISAVFDKKPGAVTLHELYLGKTTDDKVRGVRDIVPHMGGFLILAGPVNDPEDKDYKIQKGDYTIYAWPGKGTELKGSHDLRGFGVQVKPEAIVPLEEKEREFRALVLFDGPDEGMPTPVPVDLK